MRKKQFKRDFDYYIDEYMYNCRSRKLRPKTMISYEQTLRLFERWCLEEANITEPSQVLESTIRHYICSLQDRGKSQRPVPPENISAPAAAIPSVLPKTSTSVVWTVPRRWYLQDN